MLSSKEDRGELHYARSGDELCYLETVSPPPPLGNLPHQKCPGRSLPRFVCHQELWRRDPRVYPPE